MSRSLVLTALVLVLLSPLRLPAEDESGPTISITSPDVGTTYVYGSIKTHSLYWDKKEKALVARITFTDAETDIGLANDDTHDFRLFGITFDPAKGVFTAKSAKGEVIPIAHYKKSLFIKSIETTPNAAVRVLHPKGAITVILEAISPNDPAMHSSPGDPDATHQESVQQILQ